MDSASNNPYIAPDEDAATHPRKTYGRRGSKHCPNCEAPIDRWKIGNSIGVKRCANCKSKLWLEFGWKFFIGNAIGIITIYIACVILPPYLRIGPGLQYVLRGFQKAIELTWPFALIFLRILLGYPVAYRNLY